MKFGRRAKVPTQLNCFEKNLFKFVLFEFLNTILNCSILRVWKVQF